MPAQVTPWSAAYRLKGCGKRVVGEWDAMALVRVVGTEELLYAHTSVCHSAASIKESWTQNVIPPI